MAVLCVVGSKRFHMRLKMRLLNFKNYIEDLCFTFLTLKYDLIIEIRNKN